MSTLLYESLTYAREVSDPATAPAVKTEKADGRTAERGVSKLVDIVTALVPAEVLAAHAALLGVVSQSSDPADKGPVVVSITDETWARRFWWFLLFAAIVLYAFPHARKHGWDRWDFVRTLIPAGAFVAWTWLQKATLFDAVADWSNLARVGGGTVLALVALLLSKTLAEAADEKKPSAQQLEAST